MRRYVSVVLAAVLAASFASAALAKEPPQTGFEQNGGTDWTTHDQELEFLAAVDKLSDRVEIDVIGETAQGRPLHLVQLGFPKPVSAAQARKQPTLMFVCTQHGSEPAGREACLKLLRDLAFTDDTALISQLEHTTILFVPTANPDGRAANTRENSAGVDINRDHLNLKTPEAQAMAAAVRDWQPDLAMDLHEYGPSIPVLYDDEVLILWPRNLNTDQEVHDAANTLVVDHLEPKAEEAGYSADEYGQYEVADQDIHESAGDGDEGIMRNVMGLRHSLGVLVETAVTEDPRNGPGEITSPADLNNRRVDAHMTVVHAALEFMRTEGESIAKVTAGAAKRKTAEGRAQSAPVYFDGADNAEPTVTQDPAPCGYQLDDRQLDVMETTFKLLGIKERAGFVSMGQPAEPLIPLLLDERGLRHSVAAEMVQACARAVKVKQHGA